MNRVEDPKSYFALLAATIKELPLGVLEQVTETLVNAYLNENSIYLFGNGGSASLASHFACDLGKGTVNGAAKRFKVMALTDNLPLITAWANDSSYEYIFSQQLTNFIRPHDVAFAISVSGNSQNVLNALQIARDAKARTVGIAGFKGGLMKDLCDVCVIVPSENMQIVEDLHLSIAHAIFTAVRPKIHEALGVCA